MKKVVSVLLVAVILSMNVVAFATMEEKLENHWSKNMIEKDFLVHYFPYLAKENFGKFEPKGEISKRDFILSVGSLLKEYNLNINIDNAMGNDPLTREEIVSVIGENLIEMDVTQTQNLELPFKDINTMSTDSIELLKTLYNLKIIYGVSDTSFAPDKKLSQVEAIIILQRLKGVLEVEEEMKEISFNITGIAQSYSAQEAILVKEGEGEVIVTITKSFPTPGYSVEVERIVRGKDGYKVYLKSIPPKKGTDLLQVITYKIITIEINKDQLIESSPYIFNVDGMESNLYVK